MAINFPNSPGIGSVFVDTTSGFSYEWTGSLWKSFSGNLVSNIKILDNISGSFNGSETTFNLTSNSSAVNPVSAQQIELHVNGVQQAPGVNYTISGSTVVFTSPPTGGHTFFGKLLGTALSLNTIAAGSDGSGLINLSAGQLTGALPAIDGSALTGIVAGATLSAGSGSQRVVLTGQTSGSMTAAATDAELTYNSGTDTLSAGTFSGALTGNASGTAGGLTGTPDITIRNLTGVAATFTGLLTYEDVTNVDSVGFITARAGIKFGLAGVGGTITADGHAEFVGVCTATKYFGDGSELSNISVGLTTESLVSSGVITLNLTSAQDHKVTATGICTITCTGGSEGDSHTVRIVNSGIATVGFSTFFLFPSGSSPALPTSTGAISLVSFTINRVGAGGTQLLAGASVNFS